jgi:hypothetical protein
MKIEALTPEQTAQLVTVRNEWIKIGLSTEPADRPRAEAAVPLMYAAAGLEPPKIVIWLDSPLAGYIGARVLTEIKENENQIGHQVGHQVWNQVWNQVGDQVWNQVGGQVRNQIRNQVGGQVGNQVRNQIRNQVRDPLCSVVYGSQDAGWLSYFQFFKTIGLVSGTSPISGLLELAQSCGWVFPFQGAIILTERPNKLVRDELHNLHCEDGPALSYPDGFSIYAWHGVRVPERVILTPELITPKEVLNENNQEVRRVMLERYGWDRVLADFEATEINTDRFGTLYQTDKLGTYLEGEDAIAKFVKVRDPSTDRVYALRVPPTIETAQAAVAWTFDTDPVDYQPTKET